MVIFLCRDDFDSILCGVYDAWMSRLGHDNVRLQLYGAYNMELFAEYRDVEVSEEKINKVADAVVSKISREAYGWIYNASLSFEEEKADRIYRFLIYGFHIGSQITANLQIPAVHEIFRMNRNLLNEAHNMKQFLRFSELKNRVLFSKIGPKNDVLPMLALHFSDRLRPERFIIYDEHRERAVIYAPDNGWYILAGESAKRLGNLSEKTDQKEYETLWKIFFNSIAIKERENYVCQRGHLALRYRPYMTEFQ